MLKSIKKFFFEEEDNQNFDDFVDNIKETKKAEPKLEVKTVQQPSKNSTTLQDSLDNEAKNKPIKKDVEAVIKEVNTTKIYDQFEKPKTQYKTSNESKSVEPKKEVYSSLNIKQEILEKMDQVKTNPQEFRPTPIISPIHGIIGGDKSILEKKQNQSNKSNKDLSSQLKFDDVRKKAFGKKETVFEQIETEINIERNLDLDADSFIENNGELSFNFGMDQTKQMGFNVFEDEVITEDQILKTKSETFGEALESYSEYGIEYDNEDNGASLLNLEDDQN